ncbi:MAG: ABC transporter ATP-binding protein [Hyphomicrobiaceae bacterium]|nr:ABC transporter ATP-binding protein [Hyphomicrobiaceae bacterium]
MKRLWRDYLAGSLTRILAALFLIFIVAGTTSLYPLLIQWAYDGFAARSADVIWLAPIAATLVTLVKSAAMYGQAALVNGLMTDLESRLRSELYDHLIEADLAETTRVQTAVHTARFTTDITYVLNAVERFVKNSLRDGLTMLALVGTMFWIDWKLALATLVLAPVAIFPIATIGTRLRKIAGATQARIGDMTAVVQESLGAARVAKTYNLEGWLKARAAGRFDEVRALRVAALNAKARVQPTLEALGGLAVAAVVGFAGWRIVAGEATLGSFTAFISALIFAAQPLNGLGQLHNVLQEGLAALKRLFDTLDTPATIVSAPGAPALAVSSGAIRFEGAGFSYARGAAAVPALADVTLEIPSGATVAFVGPSGAGKSTLFQLMPRLYDLTSGTIHIDGQEIRSVDLVSLRAAIGVVSQDVLLFDDTIAANIALADAAPDPARIAAAAKAAAIHEFIAGLPEGYATRVGERGARLSGGERQRISIARALYKNAPILLLDEATSALDAESEGLVQAALAALSKNRTTLVIAHRLATVLEADLIVVLEDGRVVETGTHTRLLAAGGLYAQLHARQFREVGAPSLAVEHPVGDEG